MGSTRRPKRPQTSSSRSGGTVAWEPTGPEILPTAICSFACVRRWMLRRISSYQAASLRPREVGSAWTPWLRPRQPVFLCAFARTASAADLLDGIGWDSAALGPGLADGDLDLEPGVELVLVRPDAGHFGASVAGDHEGGNREQGTGGREQGTGVG